MIRSSGLLYAESTGRKDKGTDCANVNGHAAAKQSTDTAKYFFISPPELQVRAAT
jgi:hypothetical protein